jgi:hypothetical protein
MGLRGGAIGWGTALEIGKLRGQFLTVSLDIFPTELWPLGSTQPLTGINTRNTC